MVTKVFRHIVLMMSMISSRLIGGGNGANQFDCQRIVTSFARLVLKTKIRTFSTEKRTRASTKLSSFKNVMNCSKLMLRV